MRRRGKADGKTIKAQRRKTLTRRVAPEGISSPSNRQETNITRELHEARDQQMATAEILRVIRTSPNDVQPVFETIVRNAVSLCGGLFANVFRFDGEVLHYVASHNVGPSYADMIRAKYPMRPDSSQVSGRVVLTKSVVWLEDALTDPDYDQRFPVAMGWRRLLGVPMLREGEPIGAIGVGWAEPGPASKVQEELLKTFADQAVIAIENTRLLNELRESLQQQTATADVLKVISRSTFDLPTVLQTLVESAARLCDADKATITREKNGAFYRAESYGFSSEYMDYIKNVPIEPDRSSISGRSLVEGRAVHVADVTNDPEHKLAEAQRLGDYRTALAVPMLREGVPIGVLSLVRNEVRPFSDKQVDLVTTFADQAAIAIENVRLFDEVQARTRDLAESLQQQTATADVLKVISRSTFDLQPVLDTLTESAARLCDADLANIWRPHGSVYRLAASHRSIESKAKDYLENISLEPSRGSCVGRTLLEARTVHIHDIQSDPEYALETSKLKGWRTMLGVPLLREGVPIGVIALVRSTQRPFTAQQIELVTTFADQAVIAIENVRLFEDVQARTRELAKSLEELRTTQDRLVQTQKLASLGQLTAGIAHEIKNPLNFVNNFSGVSVELIDELREALAGANLDSKLRAEISEIADTLQGNLDKVVQHGKRADAIVKNMLLHSREGSGEHRPIDINALVEESLNLAYHGARAEKQGFNISLERSFDPTTGEADIFPQDITRVLLNLISNGFYAATKRGAETNGGDYEPTLAAATKNRGDRVEITIRDNGMGIPADVKEKMFNPFFTTKPAGEGTGLGLSISHDIVVKQHGGSIEVETQPGEFTEIKIVLPRAGALPQ